MNKDIKILCVCRAGVVRSVATKSELYRRGFNNVIAVGGLNMEVTSLNFLCKWADIILLAKPRHGKNIEDRYKYKINTEFTVGDDLGGIVKKQLNKIGLV